MPAYFPQYEQYRRLSPVYDKPTYQPESIYGAAHVEHNPQPFEFVLIPRGPINYPPRLLAPADIPHTSRQTNAVLAPVGLPGGFYDDTPLHAPAIPTNNDRIGCR